MSKRGALLIVYSLRSSEHWYMETWNRQAWWWWLFTSPHKQWESFLKPLIYIDDTPGASVLEMRTTEKWKSNMISNWLSLITFSWQFLAKSLKVVCKKSAIFRKILKPCPWTQKFLLSPYHNYHVLLNTEEKKTPTGWFERVWIYRAGCGRCNVPVW